MKLPKTITTILLFLIFNSSFLISSNFLPSPAHANVVINEIHPNPLPDQPEWIELVNTATSSADLDNWIIEDQLSTPSTIYQFSNLAIEPGEYLSIDLPTAKLNNSADGVTLKNAEGELIDQMSYESSESDKSWARVPDITGDWQLLSPSKGEANPSPEPSPTPSPTATPTPTPTNIQYPISNIQLSEIMSCPLSGESEWLELYNNSSQEIDLEEWYVKDASDNKKTINDLSVAAESYAVFEWSGSLLNNSGDTISLFAPNDDLVNSATVTECSEKGNSFVLEGESWQETSTSTPGESNIFTSVEEESEDDEESDDSESESADGEESSHPEPASPAGRLDSGSNSMGIPDQVRNDSASSQFTPPLDPESLVLGTSTDSSYEEVNSRQIKKQYQEDKKNAREKKLGLSFAIMSSGILTAPGAYRLTRILERLWLEKHTALP